MRLSFPYNDRMAARHAEEKREVVTCRIEPGLIRAIDALAEADRRSRSEKIEEAIRCYVAGQVKPATKKRRK